MEETAEQAEVTERLLACANSIARTNFSMGPGEDIPLEAFQLDSLSLFAFLVEVEKSFGIDFDEALLNIENLPTIRTTAAFIASKMPEGIASKMPEGIAFEELAQNGVRRETVPDPTGGARRTLCAS